MNVTQAFLEKSSKLGQSNLMNVVIDLYNNVWDQKEQASAARKENKNILSVCGMHHTPTVNKKGKTEDADNIAEESATILTALSSYTGKSSMYIENICYNAVQTYISKTRKSWKDSFYPNQDRLISIDTFISSPM
eukprot:7239542-Ditylum_brightwellii.AAC.1